MFPRSSRKLLLLIFFHFVPVIQSGFAQVKTLSEKQKYIFADSSGTSVLEDFKIGLNTGTRLVSIPAHFETSGWIYAGAALAAAGTAIFIDNDIRNNLKNNHTRFLDNVGNIGHIYGNAAYAVAFSGLVYLGGKTSGQAKFTTTGRMLLESLLYAGITATVIKTILGRSRPYTGVGPYRFNGFQLKTETTSLPSGHVTVAFAVSSVLAERIDNVYASLFLYSFAASTVFQRMYDDKHWASDTILGAVIGYTIGKAVVKYDNNRNFDNVKISTYYLSNGCGLNLKYNF